MGRLQWGHGLSAVEMTNAGHAYRADRPSFNGATAFQPWKSEKALALRPCGKCFNGATAFQPWKLPGSRKPIALDLGFNGATAFQPWKWGQPVREFLDE